MTYHHFENEDDDEDEYEAGGSGGIVGSNWRWKLAQKPLALY